MLRSILIIVIAFGFFTCNKSQKDVNSQAKYTYGVQKWETLGSQTLVVMDAGNPSQLEQDIQFTVEVFNTDGKKFSKDTTIHFNKEERSKDFQLLIDTEGEVEKVKIEAKEI
ncbi:MAG: hypothetical protein R2780_09320 [Crocinitomicaceae bacterium]